MTLQGTSLWPTTMIRLVSIVICGWLIANAAKRSSENTNEITNDFGFRKSQAELLRDHGAINARRSLSGRMLNLFSWNFGDTGGSAEDADLGFWRDYLGEGRWWPRLSRALIATIAMMIFFSILGIFFGWPVIPERRGSIGLYYWGITFANVVVMLLLLFLAAGGALYLLGFIRKLRHRANQWPAEVRETLQKRIGVPTEFLDDWIDLEFIARRTKAMSILIYYPFVAIALMIFSRSKLLDNFSESVPILVTTGISIAIVIGCSVALCRSAEFSRHRLLTGSRTKSCGRAAPTTESVPDN